MRMKRTDPFGIDDDWFNGLFGQDMDFNSLFRRVEEMMGRSGLDNENVKYYGYSMTMGPDGIPQVKEWGNHKPNGPDLLSGRDCGGGGCGDGSCGSLDPDYTEAPGPRIPFPHNPEPNRPGPQPRGIAENKPDLMYEISELEDGLNVYIELPGVSKEDITLKIFDERVLHLLVNKGEKKIDRVIQLPQVVDGDSITAKANNGILVVTLKTQGEEKKEGKKIKIE